MVPLPDYWNYQENYPDAERSSYYTGMVEMPFCKAGVDIIVLMTKSEQTGEACFHGETV